MKFPIGQKCTILIFRENRFHAFPYLVCQKTTEIFSRIAPLRFVARDFKPPSAVVPGSSFSKSMCMPSLKAESLWTPSHIPEGSYVYRG